MKNFLKKLIGHYQSIRSQNSLHLFILCTQVNAADQNLGHNKANLAN